MKRLRSQLTFANVTAVIALFVALGGGAYAATSLPKNSVGAKQIKANAVTSAKIKNGAVTAAKIAPGSISNVATADNANHATTADSATRAGNAETATRATSAETANRSATAETATRAVTAESATRATTSDTATHADSATNADHATSAGSATNADHATSADSATSAATAAVATDANTLDGLSSDSFAPVTNFLSGAADVSVTSSQLLLAVPDGPELLTTGTGANDFNILFRNPLTSTESWTLSSAGSRLSEVPPGGFGGFTLIDNVATITLYSESMKRSVTAVCTDLPEVTRIGCAGTLYEAGA
jgi:hypothetical protein